MLALIMNDYVAAPKNDSNDSTPVIVYDVDDNVDDEVVAMM